MSTMATLNLPATTSGIWRLAPPWAPVPAQSDAAADDPLGAAEPLLPVPEQAPTMTTAAVSNDSSRRRDVTMDSPPRRALGRVRTSGSDALASRIQKGGPNGSRPGGSPEGKSVTDARCCVHSETPAVPAGVDAAIGYHRSDVRTDRPACR